MTAPLTRAQQLAWRRKVAAAAAKRRGARALRFPRPVPPAGAVAAYTGALRAVVDTVHGAILDVLHDEGLVPDAARADAEGDVPRGPDQLTLPGIPMERVRKITKRVEARIAVLLKKRPLLARVEEIADLTVRHSRTEWARQVKAALGVDLPASEPDIVPAMRAFREENADLITSLVRSQVERVRDILTDAGAGTRVEEIARSIREDTDATRSRANLIARDQVLKLNAQVTQKRHEAAGVTEYVWRISRDERVRADHKALDGKRFRYDQPPVVDQRRGERANPGTYYQCRCTAEPIIPGFDDAPITR